MHADTRKQFTLRAKRQMHPDGWLKRYNRRAGQLATHFEIFRSTTLWLIKF